MLNHLIAVLRRRSPTVVELLPAQSKPVFCGNGSHTLETCLPLAADRHVRSEHGS